MTTVFVFGILLGLGAGIWLGTLRAERGIARSAMRRTWTSRKSWRRS